MVVETWNTEIFRQKLRESDKTLVVDFYTDWCPSCRTLAVVLDQVAKEWTTDAVVFGKVNVSEETELMREYGIRSVPTVMLFEQGVCKERSVGVIGKNKLTDMIVANAERTVKHAEKVLH